MNTRKPEPIICRVCQQEHCVPCGKFAEIDYKAREGVCKGCAGREAGGQRLEAGKLLERANAHSLLGAAKMNTLAHCLNLVKDIAGATAELGVYKGGSALLIASTVPSTSCYLFDTFNGIPFKGENDVHNIGDFQDASLEAVKSLLKDCPNVQYRVGLFPETVTGLENETYKFVHVDGDQYQTTKDALAYFYPRMAEGGIMLFDDFGWKNCPGVAKALNEFLADKVEGLEYPTQHQAVITKGKVIDKSVLDVRTSGLGIGDAVCALYACCGAAKAGYKVRFYTDKTDWLKRASYAGVEIVTSASPTAIDVNQEYGEQLKNAADRKQWYCDNLAFALGVESFMPVAPNVDKSLAKPPLNTQRYVVLSPFSLWKSREWPKDNWRELARLLQRNGYSVVALHAGNEAEKRLKEYFGDIPGVVFFWGHSAEWVQEVMLSAHAVIGNDSGMAHVSGMLGVKTIAVHTHTKRHQLWSYTDVISVHATGYDCVGCNWNKKQGFRAECSTGCAALRFTTPMQVMAALGENARYLQNKKIDKPLYFLHIPKTAGTSLNRFLDNHFKTDEILLHEVWNYLLPQMPDDWSKYRLFHGHFGYSLLRQIPDKPFLLTFLRNPVERTLSQFHHMVRDPLYNNWMPKSDFIGDLERILVKHPQFFSNNQTRYIAHDLNVPLNATETTGYLYDNDPGFLAQPAGLLNIAKKRLSDEFDFIGFTEDYENSLSRLCELMGWKPYIQRLNASPGRKKQLDYPAKVIDKIIELNQDDIALYEYARSLI